jgi:hypothetical protein
MSDIKAIHLNNVNCPKDELHDFEKHIMSSIQESRMNILYSIISAIEKRKPFEYDFKNIVIQIINDCEKVFYKGVPIGAFTVKIEPHKINLEFKPIKDEYFETIKHLFNEL